MPSSCTRSNSSTILNKYLSPWSLANESSTPNKQNVDDNFTLPVPNPERRFSSALESNYSDSEVVEINSINAAHLALQNGNHEELVQILDDKNSQFNKNTLGQLLLTACELNSDLQIAKSIIGFGANVNYANSWEDQATTCLMVATKNNNLELVEMLVKSGAKVNIADRFGWTALFYASYFGNLECAKFLLENEAHVNVSDSDGMSCLIWASGRGQLDLVELLISAGANVNSVDRYNSSALLWASRKGECEIVKRLLQESKANLNQQGMYGWSPLIAAVKGNHRSTVNLLLEYEPELGLRDGEHMSALMISCADCMEDIALDLIRWASNLPNQEAIINQVNNQGMSPLMMAAKTKSPKLVKALLDLGACVEQVDCREGRSAVHWSIVVNDVESYKMFLELGHKSINPNSKDSKGQTHLMLAAKYRSEDIMKFILDHSSQSDNELDGRNQKDISNYLMAFEI